jgi:hypothetical protein
MYMQDRNELEHKLEKHTLYKLKIELQCAS